MQKLIPSTCLLLTLGLLALAGAGCSPQAKKAKHLAQADRHFAAGEYDSAEIEYKNVLQIEPLNPPALGRLGIIYFDQSRTLFAKSYLQKASELAPTNLEVLIKLGLTDIAFRNFAGARAKASLILDRVPQHEEAPLLLAEATTNPKEIEEARQRLKQLPPANVESAPVYVALGILELRQNKVDTAEAAFQRALALNPKSIEAHAAMGAIHLARKNLPRAEPEFKQAADLSPARSAKRILYAQLKIQNGDAATGRKLLADMSKATPDYLPAWMALAQLAAVDKKYDEALALVAKVLARDSLYPEALLLSARLRLAKGEFAPAVAELERAVKIFPTSPQFLYQLGLAYVASGDTKKASEVLNRTLGQAPGYTDATVLLAGLNLRTGDPAAAVGALKTVVQQHPELIQPRLLLADAYRVRNNLDEALGVYDQIEVNFPNNPRTSLLRGAVLLQQKKRPEARLAFNQALERAPDLPLAMEQLVNLDLLEKQYPAARQLVDRMIAKEPKSPGAYVLLAKVHAAQKEMAQAEAALQQAIDLRPDVPEGYFMLAGLHLANNQQQKALDNLQTVLTANPKDTKALMMTGMLHEQLKHYETAQAAYEKLLTIDPKSGIALNNLAFLYAERLNQLDKGFEAAQKARELFPLEPHIADTLGWILIKRLQYPWALTVLQESAEKLPTSAEVQYHLGVAHYLLGEAENATRVLESAVQLNQEFAGLADAKQRLTVLGLDPSKAGPGERKLLDNVLKERPNDVIALMRLAAIHERAGDLDQASDANQAALKASPTNVGAMLNLVRLYTRQKEPAKAIEQARAARKLAPDNPAASLALGRLAYATRDYPWAFNLLQETARKLPNDPEVLRDLAKAAYSVGRVAEAETALQGALQLDATSTGANESRAMLELLALADNPAQAVAAAAKITPLLKATPVNVPALMVAGAISEQKPEARAALATYEKVLEEFPDFLPAKKRLAILLAANSGDNKRAFDLGLKARAAFPDDAELARAFGIILYRQEDFPRALALLKESTAKSSEDAELAYYLGLTQFRLNNRAAAKQSLQRALDLKLKADLAADARKILAELK